MRAFSAPSNSCRLHLTRLVSAIGIVGAAAMATPAGAAQPVILTPAGTPLLPTILYVLPYAVSFLTGSVPDAETVVTIGTEKHLLIPGTTVPCNIQVEWLDWDGTSVGVSGPVPLAPAFPADGSWEFTTEVSPGGGLGAPPLFPFILNVYSNLSGPFEGKANIRTDCPSTTKLTVDAEFVVVQPTASTSTPGSFKYKTIQVVKITGNVGD
jgi:hypothetical protein